MGAEYHVIVQTVKMPLELQNLASAGVRSGKADSRHCGLGTGVRIPDQLGAGYEVHDPRGQPLREYGLRAVHDSDIERVLDRGSHSGVVVSEDRRSETGVKVDVSRAVRRDKPWTVTAFGQKKRVQALDLRVRNRTIRRPAPWPLFQNALRRDRGYRSPAWFWFGWPFNGPSGAGAGRD